MMAGELTEELIAELAASVAMSKMESIALRFLGVDGDRVEALQVQHRGRSEPFNRDILIDWRNRNPDGNQVQVIKFKLCLSSSILKWLSLRSHNIAGLLSGQNISFYISSFHLHLYRTSFQKLAALLYKAAAKGAYINPHKVRDILSVSKQQAEQLTTTGSTIGTGSSDRSLRSFGAEASATSNTGM